MNDLLVYGLLVGVLVRVSVWGFRHPVSCTGVPCPMNYAAIVPLITLVLLSISVYMNYKKEDDS